MFKKYFKKETNNISDYQPRSNYKKTELFAESLDKLNHNLNKYTSLKMVFLRGLIQGLGVTLGATILAAIVVSLSIKFLGTLDFNEFSTLRDFLENSGK